jgi:hypothetical protein
MLRGLVASFGLLGALAACRGMAAARDVDAAEPVDAPETPDAFEIDAAIDALVDAAPDGPPGVPDLQFVADDMQRVVVMAMEIPPDDCAVEEQCVGGTGVRQLLRFKTVTVNRGTGDFEVGKPPPPEISDDKFVWSPCHKHHHLRGYTRYELVNGDGVVMIGRKQAFCLSDNKQVDPGIPFPHYQCTDQGLSRGWADVYDIDVACQWLDVTDVAPGMYTLRIIVNPEGNLPDSDKTNNVFTKEVLL